MRRDALAIVLVLLLLVVLGLFAWLTRDPAAPFFERAERAPVIGGVVARLRRHYLEGLPPPALLRIGRTRHASPRGAADEIDEAPGLDLVREREWIGLGAALRSEPHEAALVLGQTRELSSFEVLERRGSWVRIPVPTGGDAWVDLAAPRDTSPPLGEAPLPPRPLAARPADSRRLDAALALLESSAREFSLGGYRLLHDLDEAAWRALEPAVRVALEGIEPLYSARYGVSPVGRPAETLILFRSEQAYRKLQLELPEVGGAPTTGHAAAGLVATFAGARDAREVGSTLAHEIGHLLTRRALGPALPPWLDEGLADDFAIEVFARGSGGDPYAGWRTASSDRIVYGGPLAGLALLLRRLGAGQLVPLEELLAIPRETFYAEPDRERLYHQSGFLVRCLLDASSTPSVRDDATGFRAYLRGIAGGGPVGGDELLRHVERSWAELELDFRACLLLEGSRAGL